MEKQSHKTELIRDTSNDAIISRLSAIKSGYLVDECSELFVKKSCQVRRLPLINRGTYLRIASIDNTINAFLSNPYVSTTLINPNELNNTPGDGNTGDGITRANAIGDGITRDGATETSDVIGDGITRATGTRVRTGPGATDAPVTLALGEISTTELQGQQHEKCQIISLGAGFDSRFFTKSLKKESIHKFIEIDYPELTSKKAFAIFKNKEHNDVENGGCDIISDIYSLISGDLTNPDLLANLFNLTNLDPTLPTLFLSECVLMYLSPEQGNNLITACSALFTNSRFLTYEPILPSTPFGRTMARNLEARGLTLTSILSFPQLSDQILRYRQRGFQECTATDMKSYWERVVSGREKTRVGALERLDEVEEWDLVGKQYCLVYASTHTNMPKLE